MNDKWITRGYSNGYSDKYSVIYKSSSGLCDDYRRQYTGSFEHYDVETDEEKSARLLKEKAVKFYEDKEALFPEPETIREIERVVLLKVIDRKWMDHIDDMDQLKQGIGLQAYGQKDPVVQYKMMGYDMFDEMTRAITEDTVRLLMHIQVEEKVEREQVAKVTGTNKDEGPSVKGPVRRTDKKIYPNDLCPCGSGKKYKNCCGRQA